MSQDSADATHDCPITGCIRRHLPFDVLMCKYHWGLVPAPLQRAVWRAWRGGIGTSGSMERYMAVRQEAIDAVNAKLGAG